MNLFTKIKSVLSSQSAQLLDCQNDMKEIYTLEASLSKDPERVRLAQELTKNKSKPNMGLKGKYGLFGSDQWWNNLYKSKIPHNIYEGVIEDIHFSGMHNESKSFTLRLKDNTTYSYTLVADNKKDIKLYQEGTYAKVITFIEPLKTGDNHEFVWKICIKST